MAYCPECGHDVKTGLVPQDMPMIKADLETLDHQITMRWSTLDSLVKKIVEEKVAEALALAKQQAADE
jgi:hypothetical protein